MIFFIKSAKTTETSNQYWSLAACSYQEPALLAAYLGVSFSEKLSNPSNLHIEVRKTVFLPKKNVKF